MDSYDLIKQLREQPENKRTELANKLLPLVESLGHEIDRIVSLLPTLDRPEFIRKHLHRIDNSYIFSQVLGALPEESRLEFANQHYTFFSLEERQGVAALANILHLLPENNRFDFASRHANEIVQGHILWFVMKTLPPSVQFEFARPFLPSIFFDSFSTIEILKMLTENDRLDFYLNTQGDYLTHNRLQYALTLIPPNQASRFLEKNTQKMLMSLKTFEPVHSTFFDVRHPIYYSLQNVFNAIESDVKEDQQKTRAYSAVSDFFNSHYAINAKPYNLQADTQYLYLRELEAKSVASLIKTETPISTPNSELITQYSGHYIDPEQCQARAIELKSLPQDDITWDDLVFLHKNTLGLRGVTDDDMAVNEAKSGGRGDAISLARFGMGDERDLPYSVLVNEKEMDQTYPEIKAKLLKLFQEGMKWHIQVCFGYGYSVAFELISRGDSAIHAYDFGETYHLGKCGTNNFEASQVKKVIPRADSPDWNVESVYRFTIAEIKRLKQKQEPLPQYSPRLFSGMASVSSDEFVPEVKLSAVNKRCRCIIS